MDFLEQKDQTTLVDYLESPKLIQASSNATRLVNKLKASVENNALYESQQILRTIYFRFINNIEKVDALIDLLYYGAMHQLERAEFISGQDLATLFLEALAKKLQDRLDSSTSSDTVEHDSVSDEVSYHIYNGTIDAIICRRIASIVILLPDTEVGQPKFVAEALRLLPAKLLNRDLLHEIIAIKFYQIDEHANARFHFLHSARGYHAAWSLAKFHTEHGHSSEVDLFITQFVLQYLCLQNPTDSPAPPPTLGQHRNQRTNVSSNPNPAVSRKSRKEIKAVVRTVFLNYIELNRHPDLANISKPYDLPLLNFVLLLTYILDSDKSEASAFKFLVETYEQPLNRDPNFKSYLNRIGVLYFGLADPAKQQHQASGGFFNNILMSLLDGTDDDEEESASSQRTPSIMSYDELD